MLNLEIRLHGDQKNFFLEGGDLKRYVWWYF